jgi:hypothetical protein
MHAQPSGFRRRRIRIPVTSTAVPKVLTIVPEQPGELFLGYGRVADDTAGADRKTTSVASSLG